MEIRSGKVDRYFFFRIPSRIILFPVLVRTVAIFQFYSHWILVHNQCVSTFFFLLNVWVLEECVYVYSIRFHKDNKYWENDIKNTENSTRKKNEKIENTNTHKLNKTSECFFPIGNSYVVTWARSFMPIYWMCVCI